MVNEWLTRLANLSMRLVSPAWIWPYGAYPQIPDLRNVDRHRVRACCTCITRSRGNERGDQSRLLSVALAGEARYCAARRRLVRLGGVDGQAAGLK